MKSIRGKKLIYIFLIIFLPLASFFYYLQFTKSSELNKIKIHLENISKVELIKINGDLDIGIFAEIKIKDKGIVYLHPTLKSLNQSDHLYISRIQSWVFMLEQTYGSNNIQNIDTKSFVTGGIDIGVKGHFPKLVSLNLKNIQDIVENYDAILEVIESWPEFPETSYIEGYKGIGYCYSRKRFDPILMGQKPFLEKLESSVTCKK